MTVEEYNHLADMGLVEPSRGPPARVQMLTQDPCLAKLLREHTASYRQHLAHFVGVPDHYLVVMAPYMESDASGPAPSPAGAASAAALLQRSQLPVSVPSQRLQPPWPLPPALPRRLAQCLHRALRHPHRRIAQKSQCGVLSSP